MIEKPQQDDYRNRNTKQPEKHTAAHNAAPLIARGTPPPFLEGGDESLRFLGRPLGGGSVSEMGGLISQLADAIVVYFHAFVLALDECLYVRRQVLA
jgi:hypothetical protein